MVPQALISSQWDEDQQIFLLVGRQSESKEAVIAEESTAKGGMGQVDGVLDGQTCIAC